MDFIIGFPRIGKQHDLIMVVVENLMKASHFILLNTTHKVAGVAKIFMKWCDFTVFPRQLCLTETQNLPQISRKGCSRGFERI
jgi:hypothetical protein